MAGGPHNAALRGERRAVPCWTCFTLHTSTHTHPRLQYLLPADYLASALSHSHSLSLSLTLYVTEVRFAFDSLLQQRRGIPSNEYLLMIRIVHFALCSLRFIDLIRTQQQTKSCLSLSPQYLFLFPCSFFLTYFFWKENGWGTIDYWRRWASKSYFRVLWQRMAQHLCNARRN